jgi:quercetin dioxygenase-like cupin family protein
MDEADLPNMSETTASRATLQTVRAFWKRFFSLDLQETSLKRYRVYSRKMRMFLDGIKLGGGKEVIMLQQLIKNIEFSKVIDFESLVQYQEGQVVSRTLSQGKNLSLTLFAFDSGEEISSHSSDGDALVYLLDGQAEIEIGEDTFTMRKGQTIVMPAGIPHALSAQERFKMLLIVVFSTLKTRHLFGGFLTC